MLKKLKIVFFYIKVLGLKQPILECLSDFCRNYAISQLQCAVSQLQIAFSQRCLKPMTPLYFKSSLLLPGGQMSKIIKECILGQTSKILNLPNGPFNQ